MQAMIYYTNNDQLFRVEGVKNEVSEVFADSQWTVELTLQFASDGSEVSGQSWPITLSYQSGTDGNFEGDLESDLDVDIGDDLDAKLDITSKTGEVAEFLLPVRVMRREAVNT